MMINDIFDLSHSLAGEYFLKYEYPWEILKFIPDIISDISNKLNLNEYVKKGDNIFIHKEAKVSPSAELNGPLIIGKNAEIRHCAFIRGNVIIGENSVVGNSTEIKNSILFDNVQAPHYNYIGDSVLGYKSHLGAGVILSNLRLDKKNIKIKYNDKLIETGMRKIGAVIGDGTEVGCNSVLNPGTFLIKNSVVYPLTGK